MKLLVFAHLPPPVHGQSLMVQTLVEGLHSIAPEIEVHHINVRLSRDTADVGRWRIRKVASLLAACIRALGMRLQHRDMAFYYVPAPGKRGALYRDWLVLLLCRPFFKRLVLHWHAVGLGEWLQMRASGIERWLTSALLGRADLAIVLAPELAEDARVLTPRKIAFVRNGIDVPIGKLSPARKKEPPWEVLFLGLGSRNKGLFDAVAGVAIANEGAPAAFRLTFAGAFETTADESAFHLEAAALGERVVRHVGFADGVRKGELFATADLFCLPTVYPHEGQPLVLIEALAHDLPIVTTRWRSIPGLLPTKHVWFVEPHRPDQIARALHAAKRAPRPDGGLRSHYLAHYTRQHHLAALAAALTDL